MLTLRFAITFELFDIRLSFSVWRYVRIISLLRSTKVDDFLKLGQGQGLGLGLGLWT